MNKNGQVLVLFVILIPIFIIFAAFVVDVSRAWYEANKLNHLNKMVIRYGLENIDETDVQEKMVSLLYKNDINIDEYNLEVKDKVISLTLKANSGSVFGKAIGIKLFYISSNYKGYLNEAGKIVIEKG